MRLPWWLALLVACNARPEQLPQLRSAAEEVAFQDSIHALRVARWTACQDQPAVVRAIKQEGTRIAMNTEGRLDVAEMMLMLIEKHCGRRPGP